MKLQTPLLLEHPCLPEDVRAAISYYEEPVPVDPSERNESESGRKILNHLTSNVLRYEESRFTTQKYEKPVAICDGQIVSVSFSHTPHAVTAVASDEWVVGVDMEAESRKVNNRLSIRMKHEAETFKFYDDHPIIQIWTIKEATLKAIGTGLRKPMNSIRLEALSKNLFEVEFPNGKRANICSFQKGNQWISICYIKSNISELFLSKSYVPIHKRRDQGTT